MFSLTSKSAFLTIMLSVAQWGTEKSFLHFFFFVFDSVEFYLDMCPWKKITPGRWFTEKEFFPSPCLDKHGGCFLCFSMTHPYTNDPSFHTLSQELLTVTVKNYQLKLSLMINCRIIFVNWIFDKSPSFSPFIWCIPSLRREVNPENRQTLE